MSVCKTMLVLLLGLLFPNVILAKDVVVAVRADSGAAIAIATWQPTVDYLREILPELSFTLLPVEGIGEMERLVEQKRVDFVITQPVAYVDLQRRYQVSQVLTLKRDTNITQLGSVIFRHRDNTGINYMVDIPGRSIAGVDPLGFGGWLIGYNELLKNGIDPYKQCTSIQFFGFHEKVVTAVLQHKVDVGIVRTGVLERMVARGELDLQKLYIINPLNTLGFQPLHSTRLYPEWVLARIAQTPLVIAEKIAAGLLMMPPRHVALSAGGYTGWTVPLDYSAVHELMQRLNVGSYAGYREINHRQYLSQNGLPLLILISLFFLLLFLLLKYRLTNRRLLLETSHKEQVMHQLEYMAGHDALTQLPNRKLALELLTKELQRAKRNKSKFALMFIDLDGFKAVNDRFGHDRGDQVLREVALALKEVLRESDLVGRLGGDEFIVTIPDVNSTTSVVEIAQKLSQTIKNVAALRDTNQKLNASIGVIVSTVKNVAPENLIKLADNLMYQAKTGGEGGHRILEL